MTAKDKANELISRFTDVEDGEMYIGKAKQCALIAVDEILLFLQLQIGFRDYEASEYWEKVKSELEKL